MQAWRDDEFAMRTLHVTLTATQTYAERALKLPGVDTYFATDHSQFWADVKSNKMVRQVSIAPFCKPCSQWKGAAAVDGVDVHSLCTTMVRQQTRAPTLPDQVVCLLRFAQPELLGYTVKIDGNLYFQYNMPLPNHVPLRCMEGADISSAECSEIFTPQPTMRVAALREALALPSGQRGFSKLNAQALVQVVDDSGQGDQGGPTQESKLAWSTLVDARADVASVCCQRLYLLK